MSDSDEDCVNVFDADLSEEEEDETASWQDVAVREFVLRLPLHRVHVWRSSMMLAEHLCDHKEMVKGKQVLELGCGLGLPSLVALLCGAARVVASDLSPEAVANLLTAARHN
eukprot:gene16522-25345_t